MFRFLLAFFLILTTQIVATETRVEDLQSPVEVQTNSNEEYSSYSYAGRIASFVGNVLLSVGNVSKNLLKSCIKHVGTHEYFYSTLMKVCLATSFFGAADGFFTELKCPGFRPYWNSKRWELDVYWDCPMEIWLCTNSTMISDQYYAFVGCPEKFHRIEKILVPSAEVYELDNHLYHEETDNLFKSFSKLWESSYGAFEQKMPVIFEGQCAFPLHGGVYDFAFYGCAYDLYNFYGSGLDGIVMFMKDKL